MIELYAKLGRDLAAVRLAEDQGSGQRSLKPVLAAVLNAFSGRQLKAEPAWLVFEPVLDTRRVRGSGPRTIDELRNAELRDAAASETQGSLLAAALVEATGRLGQYDKAIAIERLRAVLAKRPDEKNVIEKTLSQMLAAERSRQARVALLLRVDTSNTIKALYASRASGE